MTGDDKNGERKSILEDTGEHTPVGPPIGNTENRELLAVVGNLLMEAKAHSSRLESIYEMLRAQTTPATPAVAHALVDAHTEHRNRVDENITALRALAK